MVRVKADNPRQILSNAHYLILLRWGVLPYLAATIIAVTSNPDSFLLPEQTHRSDLTKVEASANFAYMNLCVAMIHPVSMNIVWVAATQSV